MAVGEVLGSSGIDFGSIFSGAATAMQVFVVIIIVGVITGVITFIVKHRKSFDQTVHIFEEVDGKTTSTGMDKARIITLPGTSVRAFLLKNRKMYLPKPVIQTSKGHFWYFVRADGEWKNIGIQNINEDLKRLDVHYDHTDMRMANAALKKLVEKNYKKLNWVKEWAPYIGIGILILMLGVAMFINLNQEQKLLGAIGSNIDKQREITELQNQILVTIDNLVSTSGYRPAGT